MVKTITHRIVASLGVVFLLVGGVDAAASGKYPCVATCGSASTPVCGAAASDVTNNQCGTGSATYEGCSKTVCDTVCGGETSVTTATSFPVTVNSGGVEYKCFDAGNLMHVADANAKMQSVAMNCNTAGTDDGTSHTMNSMYMAGSTDHACEKWVVGAAGGSKSSVFAFALAGAAVAAAL
jgi:hypothetical protein